MAAGFPAGASISQIFIALYPNVMASSTIHAHKLTVSKVASEQYALVVMTVVAALFMPVVVLYPGWSFHVFRRRVGARPTSFG